MATATGDVNHATIPAAPAAVIHGAARTAAPIAAAGDGDDLESADNKAGKTESGDDAQQRDRGVEIAAGGAAQAEVQAETATATHGAAETADEAIQGGTAAVPRAVVQGAAQVDRLAGEQAKNWRPRRKRKASRHGARHKQSRHGRSAKKRKGAE